MSPFLWNLKVVVSHSSIEKLFCKKSHCFAHYPEDPARFGVVEFEHNGKVLSVEEKPQNPKSIYFYDHKVVEYAKSLKPSGWGKL